jgi:hypothetical protein
MRYANIIMSLFCAWVLWDQIEKIDLKPPNFHPRYWEVLDAADSLPKCKARLAEVKSTQVESMNLLGVTHDLRDGEGYGVKLKTDYVENHHLRCLPDSVDPRAPQATQ